MDGVVVVVVVLRCNSPTAFPLKLFPTVASLCSPFADVKHGMSLNFPRKAPINRKFAVQPNLISVLRMLASDGLLVAPICIVQLLQ
jgi:hypothetical protein